MKILEPDKNTGDQDTAAMYNEVKNVVNTNDDIATPLSVAYSTNVRADRIRFKSKFTMAGAVALTLDTTLAINGLGETIPFVGDGNNITISGGAIVPAQNATIATTAGVELLLVLVWSGSYWQVEIENNNEGLFIDQWSNEIRADKNRSHTTPFQMSGNLTLTWDPSGAINGRGEIKKIIGDGNSILISGSVFPDAFSFSTQAGKQYVIYFLWDTTSLLIDKVDNESWTPIFIDNYSAVFGAAEELNFTSQNFQISNDASTDNPFSIELFVRKDILGVTAVSFLQRNGVPAEVLYIWSPTNDYIKFRMVDASANQQFMDTDAPVFLNNTDFYHVIVTYDGSQASTGMNIYVNNVRPAQTGVSGGYTQSIDDSVGSTIRFSGQNSTISNFRRWNRVLTPTERANLYNLGAGPIGAVGSLKTGLSPDCHFEQNLVDSETSLTPAETGTITYTTDTP